MSTLFDSISVFTCIFICALMIFLAIEYYSSRGRKRRISLGALIFILVILYVLGLIATHYIADTFIKTNQQSNSRLENSGLLGDSAGAINALFSAIILAGAIYTLHLQRQNNNVEKFERQYYEMLRLHRLNLDQIEYDKIKGRAAIEHLFYKLESIFKEVAAHISLIELLPNEGNIEEIKNYLNDPNIKLKIEHEISYGFFFYGRKYILTKNEEDIRYHLSKLVSENIRGPVISVHEPVNSLLGHYYRHLFQTVKFISKNTEIDEDNKYHYAKLLRAQLSDFEQALLYYNSLSVMGREWIQPSGQDVIEKMCPIARYRLIKNTPCYLDYFGINPRDSFRTEIIAWKDKGADFFELNIEAP